MISSVHQCNVTDMKHDSLPPLYHNPVQRMSGLQENVVYFSPESDLDLNLSESFITNDYMSKL